MTPSKPRTWKDRQAESDRKWVNNMVVSAQQREWYGTLSISIAKGIVQVARTEETHKPPQERD